MISLHELEHGVLWAARSDPAKGEIVRRWIDESVIPAFRDRLLPVDEDVVCGPQRFMSRIRHPSVTALIGATALARGMTVVTRNTADFDRFPDLDVVNPWG